MSARGRGGRAAGNRDGTAQWLCAPHGCGRGRQAACLNAKAPCDCVTRQAAATLPRMIAFLRRRPPSLLLRLLVLAVIALGTAGGALASALGELHALSHADHPSATHDPVLEADTGHDDADDSARLLHALVHCGHCHGHGGVLPFASVAWDVPMPPAATGATAHDTHWRPAPTESLLRPPIRA